MAQLDILKDQQKQAKKVRDALAASRAQSQAQPPRPQPQATEPAGPSFYDQTTTDLADWLKPQQGTIDTRPPQAGTVPKRKNPNVSNLRFKSPIYG